MIFYYLDASAWVKRYCREPGTDWVQDLLARHQNLVCSSLGVVEVTSAIVRKARAGGVPGRELSVKLRELDRDWQSFIELLMTQDVTLLARELAQRQRLRGADAVHLASACILRKKIGHRNRLSFVSSDIELIEAARRTGINVVVPRA